MESKLVTAALVVALGSHLVATCFSLYLFSFEGDGIHGSHFLDFYFSDSRENN